MRHQRKAYPRLAGPPSRSRERPARTPLWVTPLENPPRRPRIHPCTPNFLPSKDKDRTFSPSTFAELFSTKTLPDNLSSGDTSPLPSPFFACSPHFQQANVALQSRWIRATCRCRFCLLTSTLIGHCGRMIGPFGECFFKK